MRAVKEATHASNMPAVAEDGSSQVPVTWARSPNRPQLAKAKGFDPRPRWAEEGIIQRCSRNSGTLAGSHPCCRSANRSRSSLVPSVDERFHNVKERCVVSICDVMVVPQS